MTEKELFEIIKFDEKGLIPVIAQDYHSKHVRMQAYMNEEALKKTLETGNVYYYSRSRQELWLKGDTSGYYQYLKGLSINCEGNSLLIQIEQKGGISCHTGNKTCYYRELDKEYQNKDVEIVSNSNFLGHLEATIIDRKNNPVEGSYTNYLLNKGLDKILKKFGEEACETIIAAKSDKKDEVVFEIADLMYHLSVLMASENITWDSIGEELAKRE